MRTLLTAPILLALTATLPTIIARGQATDPPYLAQMPSAARVKAEVKGADALDTAARQAAAFWHLTWIIRDLNGPRDVYRQVTPDAQRLLNTYNSNQLWYSLKENAPPPQEAQRWARLRESYENDPGFLDELLQQLFTPEFRAGYYRATGKQSPPARPASAPPAAAGTPPQPGVPPGAAMINFHGLYLHKADARGHYWLRFYEDGTVIGALTEGGSPERVAGWFKKPYENSGRYTVRGAGISFTLVSLERRVGSVVIGGRVTYTGTVGDNSLRVDTENGARTGRHYEFIALDGGAVNPAGTPRPGAPAAGGEGEVLDAETLSELGHLNLREGSHEEALRNFKKVIALNPSLRDAHFGIAQVYDRQGQYQLAVSAFERGLALPPADPELDALMLVLLGRAHHKLKQYREALGAYRRAIGLTPKAGDLAAAHKAMGDAYYALRQYPDALAAFRQAVGVDPNYAPAHHGLGFTYLAMGRKSEAQQVYRRLLSLDKEAAQLLLEGINKAP
jgi:hypothetical protein